MIDGGNPAIVSGFVTSINASHRQIPLGEGQLNQS
jgi:hypothetical protein